VRRRRAHESSRLASQPFAGLRDPFHGIPFRALFDPTAPQLLWPEPRPPGRGAGGPRRASLPGRPDLLLGIPEASPEPRRDDQPPGGTSRALRFALRPRAPGGRLGAGDT